MSHLRYYNYPGVGEQNNKAFSYSQAVRIGDRIECAGQGEFLHETERGRVPWINVPMLGWTRSV